MRTSCMTNSQSARALLMVRPVSFGFNKETAESNTFQHTLQLSAEELRKKACDEFDTSVELIRSRNIDVAILEDGPAPAKPDAVFPNNWLSTWPNGTVYLYPMATESRRVERSESALRLLRDKWNVTNIQDISATETQEKYLESTGVMIFDHINKLVYGCLSVRCNEVLFKEHARTLGYEPIVFNSFDEASVPIYHTNVVMGIQTSTAVICLASIRDEQERMFVEKRLADTGHEVIDISYGQMRSFCGNVLEVQNANGEKLIILSQTAYDAFSEDQRYRLSKGATLLPISIPTIETIGGGSARCMLAEIFLPKNCR